MGRQWLGGSPLLKINLSFGANWLIRNRSKQLCHLLGFRKYIHVNCLTNIWRKQSYFIRRPFNKLGCHHLYSSKQFDWQQPSDLEIKERGRLWFNVTVSVWFVVLKKVDDDNNSFSLSVEGGQWGVGSKCNSCSSVSGLRGGVDQDQVIVPLKRKVPSLYL